MTPQDATLLEIPASAGNRPDFHPGTGASRRAAPPLIRHIRGMRSSWSSEDDQLTGPARLTVAVPLETGIDRSMWHANGTTGETRPGRDLPRGSRCLVQWRSCPL